MIFPNAPSRRNDAKVVSNARKMVNPVRVDRRSGRPAARTMRRLLPPVRTTQRPTIRNDRAASRSRNTSVVQNALNTQNSAAPRNADFAQRRMLAHQIHERPHQLWPRERLFCGGTFGNRARSSSTRTSIASAAITYTERHPKNDAATPLNVRASRMPSSSPLNTVPSTRPRLFSGASSRSKWHDHMYRGAAHAHGETRERGPNQILRRSQPHSDSAAAESSAVSSARRS